MIPLKSRLPMKLFLDTEFTDLAPGAKLISVALVDENETYFYAELNDNYTVEDCSPFVKAFILPLLRGGDYRMSYHEVALRMGNWIEDHNAECVLVSDSPSWDIPLIMPLLEVLWPANLRRDTLGIFIPEDVQDEIFMENNLFRHFALHDAIVNKKGFMDK